MMTWKKIWYFIWKDDSLASWLVNVVLAIVLVKFVIYPGLGLILGSSFPVVAVVSCSMEHGVTDCDDLRKEASICGVEKVNVNNFDDYWKYCGEWYNNKDITKEMFKEFSLSNGFNKGDIMVLYGRSDIKLGDVIVFNPGYGDVPIIHRVIGINEDTLMTKGDHNQEQMFFERSINKEGVYGKAIFRIPYLGWVKVIFTDLVGVF